LYSVVAVCADGEHTSLSADVSHVSTVEAFGELGDGLVVDFSVLLNITRVNFKNVQSVSLVREGNFDFTIKTSGSQEGGIKHIWPVSGHHTLDSAQVLETVKLVQQLHEGTLDFTIGRGAIRETLGADGIDFIHEDDARLVIFGVGKHFSNHTGTLSDVLIHDGGGHHFQKLAVHLASEGSSKEGFASARRTVEKDSLRGLNSNSLEKLRVGEREFNRLAQVTNLIGEASDISILNITGVFSGHAVDGRVDFSRENAHDSVSSYIESASAASLKQSSVNFRSAANNIAGPT